MIQIHTLITPLSAILGLALASPITISQEPVVTYLGTKGPILSSGASTSSKGLVYTAGVVPSFNGSIVEGGIGPQTAQVITNIALILEEAGTSWDYVLKTTVFLADMNDYSAMNEVYASMLPSPKPARTAVEVGKLPGAFLVEIEAIAALPGA